MWEQGWILYALREEVKVDALSSLSQKHTHTNTHTLTHSQSHRGICLFEGAPQGLHGLLTFKDTWLDPIFFFYSFTKLSGSLVRLISLVSWKHWVCVCVCVSVCVFVIAWLSFIRLLFRVAVYLTPPPLALPLLFKLESDAVSRLSLFSLDLDVCQPWRCL